MDNTTSRLELQEQALRSLLKDGELEKHTVMVKVADPRDPDNEDAFTFKPFTFYKTLPQYINKPKILNYGNLQPQDTVKPESGLESGGQ